MTAVHAPPKPRTIESRIQVFGPDGCLDREIVVRHADSKAGRLLFRAEFEHAEHAAVAHDCTVVAVPGWLHAEPA